MSRLRLILRWTLVGVVSLWLALLTCPTLHRDLGPVTVGLAVRPTTSLDGVVEVQSPPAPLTTRFHSFRAPLQATIELTDWAGNTTGRDRIPVDSGQVRQAAQQLLMRYALTVAALTIGYLSVALVLGRLWAAWRRRSLSHRGHWVTSRIGTGLVGSSGAAGLVTLLVVASFNAAVLESQVDGNFQATILGGGPPVVQQHGRAGTAFSPGDRPTIRVLHVSDIHNNTVGLILARDWAEQFGADITIDTGDLTSFGYQSEADLARRYIAEFPTPYVLVTGNHDRPAQLARALASAPNVKLLNGSLTLSGFTMYGRADPSFTPGQRKSHQQQACEAASAAPVLAQQLARQPAPPDLVAVHDARMALGAPGCLSDATIAGSVPLVIAGHTHRYASEVVAGTRVLHAGTTGADGLEALLQDDSDKPYSANLLTFVQTDNRWQLAQVDVLTRHHRGAQLAPTLLIDRYVVEPTWPLTPNA